MRRVLFAGIVLLAALALAQAPRSSGKAFVLGLVDGGTLPPLGEPSAGGLIYETLNSQLLMSDGGIWAPLGGAASVSTGPVWTTAFDCNFKTQPTQILSSNTTYTICGQTFTRMNAAGDATALTLTNGTGIVFTPAQSTEIMQGASLTAPTLLLQLSSVVPNLSVFTPLRITLWQDNDAQSTYHQSVVGMYAPQGISSNVGWYAWGQLFRNDYGGAMTTWNANAAGTYETGYNSAWSRYPTYSFGVFSNDILRLTWPNGIAHAAPLASVAYYDGGSVMDDTALVAPFLWPATQVHTNTQVYQLGTNQGVSAYSAMMAAGRGGGGVGMTAWAYRLTIEYQTPTNACTLTSYASSPAQSIGGVCGTLDAGCGFLANGGTCAVTWGNELCIGGVCGCFANPLTIGDGGQGTNCGGRDSGCGTTQDAGQCVVTWGNEQCNGTTCTCVANPPGDAGAGSICGNLDSGCGSTYDAGSCVGGYCDAGTCVANAAAASATMMFATAGSNIMAPAQELWDVLSDGGDLVNEWYVFLPDGGWRIWDGGFVGTTAVGSLGSAQSYGLSEAVCPNGPNCAPQMFAWSGNRTLALGGSPVAETSNGSFTACWFGIPNQLAGGSVPSFLTYTSNANPTSLSDGFALGALGNSLYSFCIYANGAQRCATGPAPTYIGAEQFVCGTFSDAGVVAYVDGVSGTIADGGGLSTRTASGSSRPALSGFGPDGGISGLVALARGAFITHPSLTAARIAAIAEAVRPKTLYTADGGAMTFSRSTPSSCCVDPPTCSQFSVLAPNVPCVTQGAYQSWGDGGNSVYDAVSSVSSAYVPAVVDYASTFDPECPCDITTDEVTVTKNTGAYGTHIMPGFEWRFTSAGHAGVHTGAVMWQWYPGNSTTLPSLTPAQFSIWLGNAVAGKNVVPLCTLTNFGFDSTSCSPMAGDTTNCVYANANACVCNIVTVPTDGGYARFSAPIGTTTSTGNFNVSLGGVIGCSGFDGGASAIDIGTSSPHLELWTGPRLTDGGFSAAVAAAPYTPTSFAPALRAADQLSYTPAAGLPQLPGSFIATVTLDVDAGAPDGGGRAYVMIRHGATDYTAARSVYNTSSTLTCAANTVTQTTTLLDGGNTIGCEFTSGGVAACVNNVCTAATGSPSVSDAGYTVYIGYDPDNPGWNVNGRISNVCISPSPRDAGVCN